MRTTPMLLAALAMALAGCDRENVLSRINPFAREAQVDLSGPSAPPGGLARTDDDRGLVDQVTALSVAPTPGGAVVEARGLPPVQGYWDVGLVERPGAPAGVLAYELRVVPPPAARRVGPAASREVVAGAFVADARLRGVSSIRVVGLRNALEARR